MLTMVPYQPIQLNDGGSDLGSSAIALLLGSALVIGVIGYAASKEGRRTDAERRARQIMHRGTFRGLAGLFSFRSRRGGRRRRRR